jgi:DNA-binding transcriptional ArsR family regulator
MHIEDPLVKEAHILLHPTRYRIAKLLAERPMHIRGLTEAMGEDTRLVSYHLQVLEEHGFVSSEFECPKEAISHQGRAVKKYGVTGKGHISYQLLILEGEGFLGDNDKLSEAPELKGTVVRKFRATDKAEGVLLALKKEI